MHFVNKMSAYAYGNQLATEELTFSNMTHPYGTYTVPMKRNTLSTDVM
jgi:hypothetical protein